MNASALIGTTCYWEDPDDGLTSRWDQIASVDGDLITFHSGTTVPRDEVYIPGHGVRVDQWMPSIDEYVRASFTYIGEGYEGDYEEDDASDAALLRLDIQIAGTLPMADDLDGRWAWPQGEGSICTHVRLDHATPADLERLLSEAIAEARTLVESGGSFSGLLDHASRWNEQTGRATAA